MGFFEGLPDGGAGTEVPGPWVIQCLGPAAIWLGTPGHSSMPQWVGWDLWPTGHYSSVGPRTLMRCTPPRVDIVCVVQPGQNKISIALKLFYSCSIDVLFLFLYCISNVLPLYS